VLVAQRPDDFCANQLRGDGSLFASEQFVGFVAALFFKKLLKNAIPSITYRSTKA